MMSHSHVDLSSEQTMLDRLWPLAWKAGAGLAIFGVFATLILVFITPKSGGDAGHGPGAAQVSDAHGADEHAADPHAADPHAADPHAATEHADHGAAAHSGGHHTTGHVSEPPAGKRWVYAYLIGVVYFLSITLGSLFFIIIHHLVRAGWSTSLRRLAEGTSRNFWLLALLMIPLLLPENPSALYKWMHPDAGDELISVKAIYLNQTAFTIRILAYFFVWIALSTFYHRLSVKQDETGDPKLSRKMGVVTPIAVLLFAITVSFASFDLLMSLDAHWFSTIFGIYFFAGCVLSWHAFLALKVIWLQSNGRLTKSVTPEHLQDIGKMVFAFTVFWAYIGFSQYMLYWYGNVPEETSWYLRRQAIPAWGIWGFFLVFGHFVAPFLFMLSKHVKRKRTTLAIGASWVLIVHWCDLYYLVMPQLHDGQKFPFQLMDVTIFLTMGGVYIASTAWFLRGHSLLAKKDPRLHEALAFHNA